MTTHEKAGCVPLADYLRQAGMSLKEMVEASLRNDLVPTLCKYGCQVELNGVCPHGCESFLRRTARTGFKLDWLRLHT
jgi:hypothetical protein